MIAALARALLVWLLKLVTGANARWVGCQPSADQRIYFANHTSHADFLMLWATLPPQLRLRTRPVAARDYWWSSRFRRFLAERVFNAVAVERRREPAGADPLAPLEQALREGASLILFPEGTRNLEPQMRPFKSGLFHLASRHPDVQLVPAYIDNLNRVLPKGEYLPVPLICTVSFGAPIRPIQGEDKDAFLSRARQAVLELSPP